MIRKETLCLLIGLVLATPFSAVAALDGVYKCKNSQGLPDNVYSIQSVSVGTQGKSLPLVAATRFYRANSSDPKSPIKEAKVSGIATVSEVENSTLLMIGALRLEFNGDVLFGCQRQL